MAELEIIDSHCHLHFDSYEQDREEVITASVKAGVSRIINVGTSLADSRKALDLATSRAGLWATVGIHPNTAGEVDDEFKQLLGMPKVVAVGEIGLDYYHDRTPKDVQEKLLRAQLEAGIEAGLPFVFHIREAFNAFWPIFDSYAGSDLYGVIHSFSAPPAEMEEVLKRGLFVGLNGLITYTPEDSWRESAKQVPLDKVLLETDAPFLTPAPYRGQRCEPKHTRTTAEFLADLRGETLEELTNGATNNTIKLFNLSVGEKL